MEDSLLIADASTLLNFLRVRRFDLVQGLHVDGSEAEDSDKQDDGIGAGIAGAPFLEGFALQLDRGQKRGVTRAAAG